MVDLPHLPAMPTHSPPSLHPHHSHPPHTPFSTNLHHTHHTLASFHCHRNITTPSSHYHVHHSPLSCPFSANHHHTHHTVITPCPHSSHTRWPHHTDTAATQHRQQPSLARQNGTLPSHAIPSPPVSQVMKGDVFACPLPPSDSCPCGSSVLHYHASAIPSILSQYLPTYPCQEVCGRPLSPLYSGLSLLRQPGEWDRVWEIIKPEFAFMDVSRLQHTEREIHLRKHFLVIHPAAPWLVSSLCS